MRSVAISLIVASLLVSGLRFLSYQLGPEHAWMSFIYFYGLGWPVYIFFAWLMVHLNAVDLTRRLDRIWFCAVTIGLLCCFLVHGIWTWLATVSPYKGVL